MGFSKAEDGGMRVGIDARLIGSAGIGRYLKNLINNLSDLDKKNDYFVFLFEEDFPKLTLSKNFRKVRANFKWYTLSEQLRFPPLLRKYRLDLVHFPHFNVPILYSGKFVVTIHDLIHQKFNMNATTHGKISYAIKQFGYRRIFKYAVNKSQKIITVSNYVKEELLIKWSVPQEKIVVTYEAVDDGLIKAGEKLSDKKDKEVLGKFRIGRPYILYVGNAHPHKNVEGLIRSFRNLRKSDKHLKLVLVGTKDFFWEKINAKEKDIFFLSALTDEELGVFYRCSSAYVQPSLEEGFGLPMLEAMALSCPVVSSNRASLPEIGGNAPIYFDPDSLVEMTKAIGKVLNDIVLRQELIKKGLDRVKKFSWRKCTEQTLEVYLNSL